VIGPVPGVFPPCAARRFATLTASAAHSVQTPAARSRVSGPPPRSSARPFPTPPLLTQSRHRRPDHSVGLARSARGDRACTRCLPSLRCSAVRSAHGLRCSLSPDTGGPITVLRSTRSPGCVPVPGASAARSVQTPAARSRVSWLARLLVCVPVPGVCAARSLRRWRSRSLCCSGDPRHAGGSVRACVEGIDQPVL
jgi:hypothetical protein